MIERVSQVGLHQDVSGLGKILGTILNEKLDEAPWKCDVVFGLDRKVIQLRTPDTDQVASVVSGLGELTIFGSAGLEPDVVVTLPAKMLPLLLGVPLGPLRLPALWKGGGLKLTKAILARDVRVRGLVVHLPLVVRVLQLLSTPSAAGGSKPAPRKG